MTVRAFLSRAFLAVGRRLAPVPAAGAVAPSPAPAPPRPVADKSAAQASEAGWVGLNDVRKSGWFDNDTGELAPGFIIGAEDVVVDLGSGDGGYAKFCGRQKAKLILIDIDQSRLNGALAALESSGVTDAQGIVSDASKLPVPDAAATRVICTEVLEHVDDPPQTMAELVRIGKPGALYLLSVPGAVSESLQKPLAPPSYFAKPNHIRVFEEADFRSLIENAGLVIEHRTAYGFFWTIWWMFFWQAGIELGQPGTSPLLDRWTLTWKELLSTKQGLETKRVLDAFAPKSIAFVARKPA